MRALVLNGVNQPLDYQEVGFPMANNGEVVVSIKFASLNHRDLWITKGQYAGIKFPTILGSDGAGLLDGQPVLINPSIDWGRSERFQGKNYRILGLPDNGTFAEQVAVPKKNVFRVPGHLALEQAAALPLAGLTAWRALFRRCQLRKGEQVLISGVGGGVALFAMQFAIAAGARVWVTSGSEAKLDKAVQLGAEGGVSYKEADWDKKLKKMAGGFDVVIDSAAGGQFAQLAALCHMGGRIGIYGGTLGKIEGLSPQIIFWKQLSVMGSTMGSNRDFKDMLQMVEQYKIVPVVDAVYDLKEGNAALSRMAQSEQFGKIVLKI